MRKISNGKTALITGASSGIGRALAIELAKRGWGLALSSRRQDTLDVVANEAKTYGVEAKTYACDTQDRDQVKQIVQQLLNDFSVVDLAILNAGVAGHMTMESFDAFEVERIVNTNLLGVIYWVESILPSMLKCHSGTLVAMSSLAGHRGLPSVAAYSASKAALTTVFESLRVDLKRYGIRAVTVEPGYVRTPMTQHNKYMPFLMEAEQAAKIILDRIERGKTMIRFPWQMALLLHLVRVLPTPLYDRIATRMARLR